MTELDNECDVTKPLTLFIDYDSADDLIGDFSDNLSGGGTFVTTNRVLPMNSRVQLILSFPGLVKPIAIDGTVRWARHDGSDGDGGVRIEFEGGGVDQLADVIDRIKNRDPKVMSRLFRVLVVDDNRHMAKLIQDGLRTAARREFGDGVSFVFRIAEDGRAAMEILEQDPFDAVIIDVYLPLLDGPHVIARARGELGLSALPIIAISAGGEAARRSALGAGANVFFDKPVRVRQVIDTIQRLLHVSAVVAGG